MTKKSPAGLFFNWQVTVCSLFISRRQGGALTPQSATPAFFIIFIVIVEKKITVIVIFFSTVIGTVIGIHCITLYQDKVKMGKSDGNFRDEQGVGNNLAGGRLPPPTTVD
ncbi:MAG: hypothetical protein IJO41_02305 [Oscillospiraceae bacterium]|nr:hypothetical protein [Oscillospiraceae bacterium]